MIDKNGDKVDAACMFCNYSDSDLESSDCVCLRGEEARKYCITGDYELYGGAGWDGKDEGKSAESVFNDFDEQEQKQEITEAQTNEVFEGYNGISFPQEDEIKSTTCEGCQNSGSMIGCFLNRYSECLSYGRFLYEKVNQFESEKKMENEDKEDENENINFIDKLLGDM